MFLFPFLVSIPSPFNQQVAFSDHSRQSTYFLENKEVAFPWELVVVTVPKCQTWSFMLRVYLILSTQEKSEFILINLRSQERFSEGCLLSLGRDFSRYPRLTQQERGPWNTKWGRLGVKCFCPHFQRSPCVFVVLETWPIPGSFCLNYCRIGAPILEVT